MGSYCELPPPKVYNKKGTNTGEKSTSDDMGAPKESTKSRKKSSAEPMKTLTPSDETESVEGQTDTSSSSSSSSDPNNEFQTDGELNVN